MGMISIANIGEALKTFYLPTVRMQLNENADDFFAAIEKNGEDIESDKITFAMKYGRNGGIGSRADDGDLPLAASRPLKQATMPTKNIFARVQFTDKIMKATRSKLASFVNVMTNELEDAMTDAKDYVSKQVHGSAKGILATCAAGSASASVVVDNCTSLAIGMVIDICDNTGAQKYVGKRIVDVDYDAKSVVLDTATSGTLLATDVIVTAGSYGLEMTGLKDIFDNTLSKLYGIDRAGNKWLNPITRAINGEIDELKIQEGIDTAQTRTGNVIDFIVTDFGTARAYQYMQQAFKRNVEIMDLKGGRKAMSYNGTPITTSKYAAAQVMRLLGLKEFKIHRLDDWDWLSEDGAVLSRVAGKAAWEASLVFYGDLGCYMPGGQVSLTGITAH